MAKKIFSIRLVNKAIRILKKESRYAHDKFVTPVNGENCYCALGALGKAYGKVPFCSQDRSGEVVYGFSLGEKLSTEVPAAAGLVDILTNGALKIKRHEAIALLEAIKLHIWAAQ